MAAEDAAAEDAAVEEGAASMDIVLDDHEPVIHEAGLFIDIVGAQTRSSAVFLKRKPVCKQEGEHIP